MSAVDVELCKAERHREGVGRFCVFPTGHNGPHWALVPTATGYTPTAWEGDDRDTPNI